MISSFQNKNSSSTHALPKNSGVVRALGITSGGLDSILSALILREQGIDVEWVNFETPFFGSEEARKAALMAGIPLTVKRITQAYMEMLKDPHCGYGGNMNPCLDCHALMFRLAGSIMKERGVHFLFSGEVMGQRPMSQTKTSLRYVEKNSGFDGYILRPLSAKVLPPTIVEEQGLVDRERLLGLSGRGRKDQMRLAQDFGITDYPAPAGGCLLTDIGFSRRLKDLLEHDDSPQERDLELLKFGRHFRLGGKHKVIVGRTKKDNKQIVDLVNPRHDIALRMIDMPGPTVLIPYGGPEEVIRDAACLCAAYSKVKDGISARVFASTPDGPKRMTAIAGLRKKFLSYVI